MPSNESVDPRMSRGLQAADTTPPGDSAAEGMSRGLRAADAPRAGASSRPSEALLAGWALNPAQAAFVGCEARFSFYVGGVGAGKSTAGALRALARALDYPGSLGLIGAPTYPMLRDATQRTVFELLAGLSGAEEDAKGKPGPPYAYHKSEGRLTLPNGSEILFRSLDEPDRVRGLNLAWFWLDEAPLCGYYAWQILKGRLRQRGFEEVTAGWATGTPRGRDGFWRDFEGRPRPGHALYRASTLANAANLPAGYVEDLGLAGALYEQEVLGLFTAFAGLVYTFEADAGEGHLREPAPETRFGEVIGGVDWGYTNPTAAAIFGLDGDGRAWQLAEWYQRRAPLQATVLPALVELTRAHGVRCWYCGPDEPEHIAALRAALADAEIGGCRVVAADDAVRAGIQTVTGLLARRADGTRGLYVAPACRHTIAEYGAYQYPPEDASPGTVGTSLGPERGQGGEASELPVKANDHLMDATRYALHSHLHQRRAAGAVIAQLDARVRMKAAWRAEPRSRAAGV